MVIAGQPLLLSLLMLPDQYIATSIVSVLNSMLRFVKCDTYSRWKMRRCQCESAWKKKVIRLQFVA